MYIYTCICINICIYIHIHIYRWLWWNGISQIKHRSPPHGHPTSWQEKEKDTRRWESGWGTRRSHGRHSEGSSEPIRVSSRVRSALKNGLSIQTVFVACASAVGRWALSSWVVDPSEVWVTGHLQNEWVLIATCKKISVVHSDRPNYAYLNPVLLSACRLQAPAATGAHNVCFQQVQDDMSKAHLPQHPHFLQALDLLV
jgi:hypothetical protein